MKNGNIGEAQIQPQHIAQIAPDVVSDNGKQQMFVKMSKAVVEKPGLDAIFKAIASKYGGDFISRIKSPQTVAQKVATKRLQGRDYKLEDINDSYGSRLTLQKKDFPKAIKDIEKVASALGMDIQKNEDASHSTYSAHHLDIQSPSGNKFEVQLMTPQGNVESLANHTVRAQHGEEPDNEAVVQFRDKQAQIAKKLPDDKAKAVTSALQSLSQQQNGQISPIQSAQTLSMAQQ